MNIFLSFKSSRMSVKLENNFLYDFYKTTGVPGVHEYFSEVVEASECLSSLKRLLEILEV